MCDRKKSINGDNYDSDSNGDNFDDNDEKISKKTNIVTFQHKCTNFWDLYLVKKKGQQIEIGDGDLGGCSMLPVRKTDTL